MSTCLSQNRIRAAADNEARADERAHLESCKACRMRVDDALRLTSELSAMAARVAIPASLHEGVGRALTRDRAEAGATTLRSVPTTSWWPRLWLTGGLAAAAAVLAVVFVLPQLDAPRTLSAAQILDRSLQTWSPASGVEARAFDLELRLPGIGSPHGGTYRIEQLIDHDAPGRHRLVRYALDGTVQNAISEDPVRGLRTALVRVDGRLFEFRFTVGPAQTSSLREIERRHVEAVIRVLQVAAGEIVREENGDQGPRYIIELPRTAMEERGLWELAHARVVVDKASFQLLELTAGGTYLDEPFSVAFHLRQRDVRPGSEVPAAAFELPHAEEAVVIDDVGTTDLGYDLVASALRALSRERARK